MNMTPEEMNTQLYEKLTAEQAKLPGLADGPAAGGNSEPRL